MLFRSAGGEIDLSAHGGLGGLFDLRASARLIGEKLDHLVADQGGIGIEDDKEPGSSHTNERSAPVSAR